MDTVLLILLIITIIITSINTILILKNKNNNKLTEQDKKTIQLLIEEINDKNIEKMNDKFDFQLKLLKESNNTLYEKLEIKFESLDNEIETLKTSFKETNELLNNKLQLLLKNNYDSITSLKDKLTEEIKSFNDQTKQTLKEFNDSINTSFEKLNKNVQDNLRDIRKENEQKLDEINKVVNEKLENTLNERLKQSFNNVIEQIGGVNKAIGEIKGLASDVGSLKTVLTNVKTKGIVGEVILSNIIKETLTVSQYDENVPTKKNSNDKVEFAIKLPNQDDSFIYLPIDSKFPLETYHKIMDAQEQGDIETLKTARNELKSQIKKYASDINLKYIDVPNTTEFAIMFLPLEGLYVEVLNLGLFEELKLKYNINIAGPTTFTAILNALQMGFKTLAIQKKSADVFTLLGAVKTEFSKFASVLEKTQKKVNEVSSELDTLIGTRTRMIQSKLKGIEKVDENTSANLLDINEE